MSNADESGLNVNNSSKEINNPRSSSTNHQTSSSSEISSDSEPEIIEKPVFQKPKDPAFSIPSDYVLQSVEDLAKDVKVSLLGKISQVFDKYVVIRSTNSAVVLNERSVLFLEDGKYLGEVYETFGPVRTPFYLVILSKSFCVPELKRENQITSVTSTKPTGDSENVEVSRTPYEVTNNPQLDVLNSLNNEENQSHNESGTSISDNNDNSINDYEKRKRVNQSLKETPVFYAPDMPELTIPVFYNQLISNNIKGSDASWVGDMEPPPEALEFSDDEQEKLHKRKLRMKRKSQTSEKPTSSVQVSSSKPKKVDKPLSRSTFNSTATVSIFPSLDRTHGYLPYQQQSQESYNFRPYVPMQSPSHWNVYPNVQSQWQNPTYGHCIWPSAPLHPLVSQNIYPHMPRNPLSAQPFPYHCTFFSLLFP
ncbi:H/ACA ribonucleoprotein complex non-core subunit NAF1 [Schistosoma japonicum]|uniref:H/ACA ribonucleoprotein complex non-core subunit NAF1 n=1 Tax=Schistosoma japonicum TaxID=6182 RepID=C1LE35_SCHJA|nr:H/ACA ribonucleoprotein complex non-core subunit NAF1 [Schistosoma japonicum]CAX72963.1 hypothetical protein [Schistosoma japonicum]